MPILDVLRRIAQGPPAPAAPLRSPTAEGIAGKAIATRNPVIHEEMQRAIRDDPEWKEQRGEHWPRILGLPVRTVIGPAEAEAFTKVTADARAFANGFRFYPVQVDMITQFDQANGLLAQAGVGEGKTLTCAEILSRCARRGKKRLCYFVPASVYPQFMRVDLPKIRTWVPLSVRFHGLGGHNRASRKRVAQTVGPACFVMPYSLLSQPDSRDLLEWMAPEVIVADEVHNLKNVESARTKRVRDYLEDHPGTLLAAMSGTLTNKQLLDYHHLAIWALGEAAPMPTSKMGGARWNSILAAESLTDIVDAGRELRPLHDWAVRESGQPIPYTIDGYRHAFQCRLSSAPGVVLSKDEELGTSLLFENLDVPEPGADLVRLMKQVVDQWLAPNGDEIAHAFHTYKWLFELTAGFYYDLVWPKPKNDEHAERIERAKEHHAYRQLYEKDLREFLRATSIPHLDTPMLVGNALSRIATRALVPKFLHHRWDEMKAREFPGMPERLSVPVRVDDYKVQLAVKWARAAKGGILWCYHDEMIDWVCEELQKAGVDHYAAKAGNLAILDHGNRDRIAVASIKAHNEGKNLQYHYSRNLFLQWMRSAKDSEQAIGRTHRKGQLEDEMTVHLALGPTWDHQNYGATLCDALYIYLTTQKKQKILYGSYAEPPKIYDPRILEHMGFEGTGKVSKAALERQFGS